MGDSPAIETKKLDGYQLALKVVVIWLFGIFPAVQIVSSRSASFFLVVAFFTLVLGLSVGRAGSLVELLSEWRWTLKNSSPAKQLLVISGTGLLTWSLLSLIWSPLPMKGGKDIVVVCGAAFSFWLLSRQFRLLEVRFFRMVFLSGLITGLLVLAIDMHLVHGAYKTFSISNDFFDLNRNAATVSLLIWPALTFVGFQATPTRLFSVMLFALCLFVVFSSDGQSAQFGIVLGLIAGILASLSRYLYRAIIILLSVNIVAFPLLVPVLSKLVDELPDQISKSGHAEHRLATWQGYTDLIWQSPVIGQGMRAHRKLGMDGLAGKYATKRGFPAKTTHPHNFILEIWINLGAIGALLASSLLLATGLMAEKLKRVEHVLLLQVLVSGYVISALGHGFTQSWWIAAIAMAGIAASQSMRTIH